MTPLQSEINSDLNSIAPVVLFVYNRPWHTAQTLASLKLNNLAKESHLIIYSDAPKNSSHKSSVHEVRDYVKTIDGFKDIFIIERESNMGLAKSIVSGVSEVMDKYGKAIVLEDDMVTSPSFLTYMNQALMFYRDIKEVWHISGWNYPIESSGMKDTFLWRAMNCWGWATWQDRWRYFEKDTKQLISDFTKKDINAFDIDGHANFWKQVLDNQTGNINTWAIYWYATIFKYNKLCLNPTQTFVKNIGLDGSGQNCIDEKSMNAELNDNNNINFETEILENKEALNRIKDYYKTENRKFIKKGIGKLKKMISQKKT